MNKNLNRYRRKNRNKFTKPMKEGDGWIVLLIMVGVLISFLPIFKLESQNVKAKFDIKKIENFEEELVIIQGNSLLPISNPLNPEPKVIRKINVVITAYSSTPWQTDDNPYITAAGTQVREGIVANNKYPFGTKIRIPEIFGDKIFVVEDRMNWEKGKYHIDIWFSSYFEAKNFGAKRTYIEVLEG